MPSSIPTNNALHKSTISGSGDLIITSLKGSTNADTFSLRLDVRFDPKAKDFPKGKISIECRLNDGSTRLFDSTSIDLINTQGNDKPTILITGFCKDQKNPSEKACYYWIMISINHTIADSESMGDIVSFTIHDGNGNKIANGISKVKNGDLKLVSQ